MALQYNVRGLNFDVAARAISDNLFRYAQIEAQRQKNFETNLDKEFRLYSGRIRKQDLGEFNRVFTEYENAAKNYSRSNRKTDKNIQGVSDDLAIARKNMRDFVTSSTAWGAQGSSIEKLRKDSKQLVNLDLWNSYMNDMTTLTTTQLNEKYGGADKAPGLDTFKWNEKSLKPTELKTLDSIILNGNPIQPENVMKVMPAFNPDGTRKRKIEKISFGGETIEVEVPVSKIDVSPDVQGLLASSINASIIPGFKTHMQGLFDKTMEMAQNPNNPAAQAYGVKKIEDITKIYNIKKAEDITPEMFYASMFVKPDSIGSVELPDWNTLMKEAGTIEKDLEIKGRKINMALAIKKAAEDSKMSALDNGNKLLTFLTKVQNTGAMNQEGMKSFIQNVFKSLGLSIENEDLNKMWQGSYLNKLSQRLGGPADEIIQKYLNNDFGDYEQEPR